MQLCAKIEHAIQGSTVYSQPLSDLPLEKFTVHFPPFAQTGSSHLGSILCLKQYKSALNANLLG